MNEIRTRTGNLVVNPRNACQFACAALCSSGESKQGDNVSGIRMEYLLIRSVSRTANLALVLRQSQVFDVSENYISCLPIILPVLATSLGCDVRGQACVNDNVIFSCVLIHTKAADDKESVPIVQLV